MNKILLLNSNAIRTERREKPWTKLLKFLKKWQEST